MCAPHGCTLVPMLTEDSGFSDCNHRQLALGVRVKATRLFSHSNPPAVPKFTLTAVIINADSKLDDDCIRFHTQPKAEYCD